MSFNLKFFYKMSKVNLEIGQETGSTSKDTATRVRGLRNLVAVAICLAVFSIGNVGMAQNKSKTFEFATIESVPGELAKAYGGKASPPTRTKIKVSYDTSKKQYTIETENSQYPLSENLHVVANANSERVDAIRDVYVYDSEGNGNKGTVLMVEKISYLFNPEIAQKYKQYPIFFENGAGYYKIILYFSTKK